MNILQRIHPVVELSPWIFEEDIEIINGENYAQFSDRVLKKYGLNNTYWSKNSLKVVELDGDDLKGIIKVELFDYSKNGFKIEEVFPFDGGLVMEFDNGKLFSHSLGSGMISDAINWLEFLQSNSKDWLEIWIGRPWIYGRIRNGVVQLTDYHDETDTLPSNDNSMIFHEFKIEDFSKEITNSLFLVEEFKSKIETCLKKEKNPLSRDLSSALVRR